MAKKTPARDKSVGEAIKAARIEQRMSQKSLAERAKLTQPYLSKLENDEIDPGQGVLKRIAEALQIGIAELHGTGKENDKDQELAALQRTLEEALRIVASLRRR